MIYDGSFNLKFSYSDGLEPILFLTSVIKGFWGSQTCCDMAEPAAEVEWRLHINSGDTDIMLFHSVFPFWPKIGLKYFIMCPSPGYDDSVPGNSRVLDQYKHRVCSFCGSPITRPITTILVPIQKKPSHTIIEGEVAMQKLEKYCWKILMKWCC